MELIDFQFFCISIFLIFSHKKYFKYFLILLSIFINEKITIFIATYYFCEYCNFFKKKNKTNILTFLFPTILFGLYIWYFTIFDRDDNFFKIQNHLNGSIVDRNFVSFHGLANSLIPILIVIFPYIFL